MCVTLGTSAVTLWTTAMLAFCYLCSHVVIDNGNKVLRRALGTSAKWFSLSIAIFIVAAIMEKVK
jgi:hypothetical protein